MRTKIVAILLAVLTALGGLNLFQSIKNRLQPESTQTAVVTEQKAQHRYSISATEIEKPDSRASGLVEQVVARTASSDVMIDERFDVSAGDNLIVDISHADVVVRTSLSDEARIKVRLDARNMSRARSVFDDMNFRAYQDGDDVVLRADSRRGNWNFRSTGGADIDVEIMIPKKFNLDLVTTHGDIELDDVEGLVAIQTTHGDIEAQTVAGDEVRIRTSHGDIDAHAFTGRIISLHTSHSEIEIDDVRSERFSATTSHSDVEIERVSGDTEISTSHGDIRINLEGSASAEFTTSHGDVDISTDRQLGASLDLRGARVRVASDYKLSGLVKKDRVDAKINGGGERIVARTTHGNVTVRPR